MGLTWYMMLTGNEFEENSFCNFDEEVTEEQIETIKKCVKEVCNKYLS